MRAEGGYNIDGLIDRLSALTSPSTYKRIGERLVWHFSNYMANGAASRHTWAERLGAEPTGVLEFDPSERVSKSRGGGEIRSEADGGGADVLIIGVPGIGRAFGDLDIYPKNASALTVPIHRESYAKTVADLERSGWHVFRRGRTLVGNHGSTTAGRAVPLFVLCGHVHVSQDSELLPSAADIDGWAISEAEDAVASA